MIARSSISVSRLLVLVDILALATMSSLTSGGRSSRSSISQSLGRSIKSPLGMSHSIGRNLAKVAVDSLSLSGIQNSEWKKGDKFDYMPTLGEDEYSKLCNDKELVLVTINYCQQGLPTNLSMANLRELIGGSFNVTQEQVEGVNEVSPHQSKSAWM